MCESESNITFIANFQVTSDLKGIFFCDMGIAKLKASSKATVTTLSKGPAGTIHTWPQKCLHRVQEEQQWTFMHLAACQQSYLGTNDCGVGYLVQKLCRKFVGHSTAHRQDHVLPFCKNLSVQYVTIAVSCVHKQSHYRNCYRND